MTIKTQANFYHCESCNTNWVDAWDCGCNDDCPECGNSNGPMYSMTMEEAVGFLTQPAKETDAERLDRLFKQPFTEESADIVIKVEGGNAELEKAPADLRCIKRDYDTEGADEEDLEKDEHGVLCFHQEWVS